MGKAVAWTFVVLAVLVGGLIFGAVKWSSADTAKRAAAARAHQADLMDAQNAREQAAWAPVVRQQAQMNRAYQEKEAQRQAAARRAAAREAAQWARERAESQGSGHMGKAQCDKCGGDGLCHNCRGTGRPWSENRYLDGECKECNGTGRCLACKGKGSYKVYIPGY